MRQVLKKIRFDAPTVDTSQKVAEEWINTVIKTSSWTCYTCDAGFMDANHIFKKSIPDLLDTFSNNIVVTYR
jgi:hypothetical protein